MSVFGSREDTVRLLNVGLAVLTKFCELDTVRVPAEYAKLQPFVPASVVLCNCLLPLQLTRLFAVRPESIKFANVGAAVTEISWALLTVNVLPENPRLQPFVPASVVLCNFLLALALTSVLAVKPLSVNPAKVGAAVSDKS